MLGRRFTLAERGLEEPRNSQELLIESMSHRFPLYLFVGSPWLKYHYKHLRM